MKKILCLILAVFMIIAAIYDAVALKVCDKFVRFHIIANSNSPYDQAVKMELRNHIFKKIGKDLSCFKYKEDTLEYLSENKDNIKEIADSFLSDIGYNMKTSVSLKNSWFPEKDYTDFVLPDGNYDSLKITIGKGKGRNFFCVMFPPACISGEMTEAVNKILNAEKIKYKFKIFSKE